MLVGTGMYYSSFPLFNPSLYQFCTTAHSHTALPSSMSVPRIEDVSWIGCDALPRTREVARISSFKHIITTPRHATPHPDETLAMLRNSIKVLRHAFLQKAAVITNCMCRNMLPSLPNDHPWLKRIHIQFEEVVHWYS